MKLVRWHGLKLDHLQAIYANENVFDQISSMRCHKLKLMTAPGFAELLKAGKQQLMNRLQRRSTMEESTNVELCNDKLEKKERKNDMWLTIGDMKRILSKYPDDSIIVNDFSGGAFEAVLPVKRADDAIFIAENKDMMVDGKPTLLVELDFKPENELLDD